MIGYSRHAASFCSSYRVVARISTANDSDEGGQPIARCTLRGTLAQRLAEHHRDAELTAVGFAPR